VRKAWAETLAERLPDLLDHPAVDVLIEASDDEIAAWAIVEHGIEGDSVVHAPSWVVSERLLAEAVDGARKRGSRRLALDVPEGDERQARTALAVGMSPQVLRYVRALGAADVAAAASERVRGADPADQLFLLSLNVQCVPYMHPELRPDEADDVQRRFLDVYASLPASDGDLRGWLVHTAGHVAAGALVARPRAQQAFDGAWESYIYDISVLPEYWGRSLAATLLTTVLHDLAVDGMGYAAGDVSGRNERVIRLLDRFGACVESRRYLLEL